MRIAFDARPIALPPDGIGVYMIKIMERLLQEGDELVLISPTKSLYWQPSTHPDKVRIMVKSMPTGGNPELARLWWEEIELKKALEETKPDLYHAVKSQGVPDIPLPTVLTFHDAIQLIFPKDYVYYYYRLISHGLAVNRAKKIIAISNNTKKDLEKFFPESADKIITIYNGVDSFPLDQKNPFKKYSPYIIYNGGFGARKNVSGLIRAFASIKEKYAKFTLILIGNQIDTYQNVKELSEQLGIASSVIFPGYIARDHLGVVLRDAFCSIYPSFYEGFGYPPIEAMLMGCPVIAANNSSLPEVVGDAGLLIDAKDPRTIVLAFSQLAENDDLRVKLAKKGLKQAQKFDWERAYQQTRQVYKDVVG